MRSFFIPRLNEFKLSLNIELWKGFFASVRPSEMGFNLNVNGNSIL